MSYTILQKYVNLYIQHNSSFLFLFIFVLFVDCVKHDTVKGLYCGMTVVIRIMAFMLGWWVSRPDTTPEPEDTQTFVVSLGGT